MNLQPIKWLIYVIKVLIASFVIAGSMVIVVNIVGVISGSNVLLEISTSRAVMLFTMLFAIPICIKYLKK